MLKTIIMLFYQLVNDSGLRTLEDITEGIVVDCLDGSWSLIYGVQFWESIECMHNMLYVQDNMRPRWEYWIHVNKYIDNRDLKSEPTPEDTSVMWRSVKAADRRRGLK